MLDCKLVKSVLLHSADRTRLLAESSCNFDIEMMEFSKYLPIFHILPFSQDIEFPSHVMLGQSVSMKCTFTKKENQQVKKIFVSNPKRIHVHLNVSWKTMTKDDIYMYEMNSFFEFMFIYHKLSYFLLRFLSLKVL